MDGHETGDKVTLSNNSVEVGKNLLKCENEDRTDEKNAFALTQP